MDQSGDHSVPGAQVAAIRFDAPSFSAETPFTLRLVEGDQALCAASTCLPSEGVFGKLTSND